MKKLLECLTEACEEAFEACGYDAKYGKATVSNRPDLCEFQCNGAMAAAKEYKKAPIKIAEEVVAQLKKSFYFSSVEAVNPGFINLCITNFIAADYADKMLVDKDLGYDKEEHPKTIVIDYGGANVAKPLHIGHLRTAIIGESVKRIMRHAGNTVIGDVHLGDWGLQMGLIIEQLRDMKPELVYFDENFDGEYPQEAPFTLAELAQIYPAASARSKEDAAFMERAHLATVKVQNGYKAYMALWEHIMNVSLPDLKRNYDNLNVQFDVWKGESDAKPYIADMVQDLVEKGLAHESQGALVVDVAEETDAKEMPPCIIRKSDGAALYATSDLATMVQREQDYAPERYIYITDKRQEMHFTQVFRAAKKAGIVGEDTELIFMGLGTMNGRDGKPFKTRTGGVMRLEQLISDVNDAVYQKMAENRNMSEEDAKRTARVVGLAAVKYGDLSNQSSKDYIFDIERFASFEGSTGPYILYTIVRIKSILRNFEEQGGVIVEEDMDITSPVNASEKSLMLELARYNEVLTQAYQEIAPHKICQYIYSLSDAFNSFYHETRILTEEDEEKKLGFIALLVLTKKVLEQCIDLLGFEAPDRM